MSEDNVAAVDTLTPRYCASCGVAEVDDIKLEECGDCDLARYCSDECQQEHKPKHEDACKKRAAELRDELLFRQPESTHLGDCPICFLPLPIDTLKFNMTTCCNTLICNGCDYANVMREAEMRLEKRCLFCREPVPSTYEERHQQLMKRAEANDPVAVQYRGLTQQEMGEQSRAFESFTKAAELGNVKAHFHLAGIYMTGDGVEKDKKKEFYHLEEAAIGGDPDARYDLGIGELADGNDSRALKHFIIAAKQGDEDSTKMLMDFYKNGKISKEDFAAALRAHQAAVDATKSPQREVADEFQRKQKITSRAIAY